MSGLKALKDLHRHYAERLKTERVSVPKELDRLSQLYQDRWQRQLDGLATGVAAAALVQAAIQDPSTLEGPVLDAFRLAYPNVPVESLSQASPEQLAGYVNAWKGKLFEVQVREQLNAGGSVAGIQLEPGQTAVLATNANQPGWDLQILEPDGSVAESLQLKATESLSYVREALERYPDIPVVATSDLAGHAAAATLPSFSMADVSEDSLQQAIEAPLSDVVDHPLWRDLLPGLPYLVIAAREGLAVFGGRKTWSAAMPSALSKSVEAAMVVGTSAALAAGVHEVAAEAASGLMGDVATELILGAALPFGLSIAARWLWRWVSKKLDTPPKPAPAPALPAPPDRPSFNEDAIRDWVLPRAVLIQRTIARQWLALPPPAASAS
jgi:hypothetical protein